MLIDIDHVPLYITIPGLPDIAVDDGRPFTHSLSTVAALGALAAAWRFRRASLAAAASGVGLHFVRDIATGQGLPVWWPFEHKNRMLPYYLVLPTAGWAGRRRFGTRVPLGQCSDETRSSASPATSSPPGGACGTSRPPCSPRRTSRQSLRPAGCRCSFRRTARPTRRACSTGSTASCSPVAPTSIRPPTTSRCTPPPLVYEPTGTPQSCRSPKPPWPATCRCSASVAALRSSTSHVAARSSSTCLMSSVTRTTDPRPACTACTRSVPPKAAAWPEQWASQRSSGPTTTRASASSAKDSSPTAWADDDTVEGLEDPSLAFAVGALWHPEASADHRLFQALVGRCYRGVT